MSTEQDKYWMQQALTLARLAGEKGEVPVGAIVVRDNEKLGEGFNQPIGSHDPTAHAEIAAIRQAAESVENYRLPGSTLYVTIEPCTMCVGSIIHARVGRLVFGAREPRAGAVLSNFQLTESAVYNHKVAVEEGVLAEECSMLMKAFFKERRESRT